MSSKSASNYGDYEDHQPRPRKKKHRNKKNRSNKDNDDSNNKTLFIYGIPLQCTTESILKSLRKFGGIKSAKLRMTKPKKVQYAKVVCFHKHVCDKLVEKGAEPIQLTLSDGSQIAKKLLIQYDDQNKVKAAKKRYLDDQDHKLQQPHYPNPYAPTLPYYGYDNPRPVYDKLSNHNNRKRKFTNHSDENNTNSTQQHKRRRIE